MNKFSKNIFIKEKFSFLKNLVTCVKSKFWKIKFEWRILGILEIVFFLRRKVSNTIRYFISNVRSSLIYVFVVTSNYLPTYFADVWFLNSTWFLPTHEHNFFNDDGWPLLVMGWVPHWLIVYFLNFGHVFSLRFFIRKLYKASINWRKTTYTKFKK